MVDMETLVEKALKGTAVGIGVFGSTLVGNTIERNTGFGNLGVAASQAALGYGAAVMSDYVGEQASGFDQRVGNILDMGIEHVGYGIHAAGVAEGADVVYNGSLPTSNVQVNRRSQSSSNGNKTQTGANTGGRERVFSVDTG